MYSLALALNLLLALPNDQLEDLRQKVTAFATDQADQYDKKYLNIADRNLGSIDKIDCAWKEEFMLKGKEKRENNLGNKGYAKFYFSIFAYESKTDRQYALKDWMADFIEGKVIRPGRDMRSFEYATPTIILIQDQSIVVCNYACSDYIEDEFKGWKQKLLQYFGEENTMVIEIKCDGPLEWTKNAPDPKQSRREMI